MVVILPLWRRSSIIDVTKYPADQQSPVMRHIIGREFGIRAQIGPNGKPTLVKALSTPQVSICYGGCGGKAKPGADHAHVNNRHIAHFANIIGFC
jgi:hypothetical protein